MSAAITELTNSVGGLIAVALALFFLGSALRSDRRLTRRVEARVSDLERRSHADGLRIAQLEDVLRQNGISVPPWPDLDPLPAARTRHRGAFDDLPR